MFPSSFRIQREYACTSHPSLPPPRNPFSSLPTFVHVPSSVALPKCNCFFAWSAASSRNFPHRVDPETQTFSTIFHLPPPPLPPPSLSALCHCFSLSIYLYFSCNSRNVTKLQHKTHMHIAYMLNIKRNSQIIKISL